MSGVVQQLVQWVSAHPHLSYSAVALTAFTESLPLVGLLVPGAVLMIAFGALVATGNMEFWPTFAAAVVGAVTGDGISYWFGRQHADLAQRLWPFNRHPEMLKRGEGFFLRHGGKSVVMARFVGPMRPVIPTVAGILKMAPMRFYITNTLSAVAWAPAYLIPGIFFGSALTLAGEVAGRLAVLVFTVIALLAIIRTFVRSTYRYLARNAARWAGALLEWGDRQHGAARLVVDLVHPARRPSGALFAWLGMLIAGTWLFFGILEGVITQDQLVFAGQSVYLFLQHLRTPAADRVMVVLTELGDMAVTLPVVVAVTAGLLLRRAWRDTAYWLSAVGFGVLLVALLKWALHIPRPAELYSGVSTYSFPSGHAAMTAIVYGYLAAFVAPALSARRRTAVYTMTGLFVGALAFSRLYLGAHWLADVAAGLAAGVAWVSVLTIAHRRHDPRTPATLGIATTALAVLLLAGAWHIHGRFRADLGRYAPRQPMRDVPIEAWRQGAWRDLPAYRIDLEGEREQPMNVQYAGELADLTAILLQAGWRKPEQLDFRALLYCITPSPSIEGLPVLPRLHNGHPDSLCLNHEDRPGADRRAQQFILRLWPTAIRLQPGDTPLWIGSVSHQHIQRLPLLSFVRSGARFDDSLALLQSSLPAAVDSTRERRDPSNLDTSPTWSGRVMLLQRAPPGAGPRSP